MTLYLLPNLLGPADLHTYLPTSVDTAVASLDGLIAESDSGGRRFLKHFKTKKKPHEMPVALLSEDADFLLEPILAGETWGVISDAGLPCLADPGAKLVAEAHKQNIPLIALPGPSSITMALTLSGLSGQQFFFHGYLPKTPQERETTLKQWENMKDVTHIFIEAPYRNQHTFDACLKVLNPRTHLCVASNLTLPDQFLKSAPIREWQPTTFDKKPTIFLFSSS